MTGLKTITEFEVVDHGIEHEQYFQGCGTSFTKFTDIAIGHGDNPAEAIEDALEDLAMGGWDVEGMEARILADADLETLPVTPSVIDEFPAESDSEDSPCDHHYYISIRVI